MNPINNITNPPSSIDQILEEKFQAKASVWLEILNEVYELNFTRVNEIMMSPLGLEYINQLSYDFKNQNSFQPQLIDAYKQKGNLALDNLQGSLALKYKILNINILHKLDSSIKLYYTSILKSFADDLHSVSQAQDQKKLFDLLVACPHLSWLGASFDLINIYFFQCKRFVQSLDLETHDGIDQFNDFIKINCSSFEDFLVRINLQTFKENYCINLKNLIHHSPKEFPSHLESYTYENFLNFYFSRLIKLHYQTQRWEFQDIKKHESLGFLSNFHYLLRLCHTIDDKSFARDIFSTILVSMDSGICKEWVIDQKCRQNYIISVISLLEKISSSKIKTSDQERIGELIIHQFLIPLTYALSIMSHETKSQNDKIVAISQDFFVLESSYSFDSEKRQLIIKKEFKSKNHDDQNQKIFKNSICKINSNEFIDIINIYHLCIKNQNMSSDHCTALMFFYDLGARARENKGRCPNFKSLIDLLASLTTRKEILKNPEIAYMLRTNLLTIYNNYSFASIKELNRNEKELLLEIMLLLGPQESSTYNFNRVFVKGDRGSKHFHGNINTDLLPYYLLISQLETEFNSKKLSEILKKLTERTKGKGTLSSTQNPKKEEYEKLEEFIKKRQTEILELEKKRKIELQMLNTIQLPKSETCQIYKLENVELGYVKGEKITEIQENAQEILRKQEIKNEKKLLKNHEANPEITPKEEEPRQTEIIVKQLKTNFFETLNNIFCGKDITIDELLALLSSLGIEGKDLSQNGTSHLHINLSSLLKNYRWGKVDNSYQPIICTPDEKQEASLVVIPIHDKSEPLKTYLVSQLKTKLEILGIIPDFTVKEHKKE